MTQSSPPSSAREGKLPSGFLQNGGADRVELSRYVALPFGTEGMYHRLWLASATPEADIQAG